ncbi:MAG: peptidoglycan-associated lipoprotein Pal [Rhodospirillales bacterium]|nr:peptidoglycan-associated lipoprotein Pal [Rhodospirillales bacterium]
MRFKFIALAAAALLLAACETAPDESATAGGAGGAGAGGAGGVGSSSSMAPKPGSNEDLVVNVGDRVFFGFNKYNLTSDARQTLEKQAAWLKKYPSVTLSVEGHCDERGTREYNLALGERRANAVKDYLAALGVAPGRIKTISYGKERPVALGSNEAAWSQNRRGVSVVSGGAGS